ncbi:MAG: DUF2218 domain-containing protein [Alphaproteobacteria bacterium]|nr:DUF2218 domain-containing protein [Alphaproteobacteria bacterium]
MASISTAEVPTENGNRYLQQLCKHWAHKLAVDMTEGQGRIIFPKDGRSGTWAEDATVTLTAHSNHLECRIEASADAQRDALQDVISSHLDRFAFREAPLSFDWQTV